MCTLKSTEEGTEKVVADENGYAVPPGSNRFRNRRLIKSTKNVYYFAQICRMYQK